MMQNRRLLFSVLALLGGISGFVLGEIYLGRGTGVYMSPFSALVGVLLAWGLWHTRPPANDVPGAAPEATLPLSRQAPRKPGNVRVTKSQQGRKGR